MVNRNQKSYDKNNRIVEVKNVATLSDTEEIEIGGQKYRLEHVIVHLGKSTKSGHYVTYNVRDSSVFNDSPKPSLKPATEYQMNVAKLSGYIYGYEIIER